MKPPSSHILWLDLETTGSDKVEDDIIEVGVALTKPTPDLPIVQSWSSPIIPRDARKLDTMDDYVRDIHTRNGLLRDLSEGAALRLDQAEAAILELLDQFVGEKKRVPLGGSGVGHFDRPLVDRDFPRLSKRLTYWPIDVGVVRRMCQMAGVPLTAPPKKKHRACCCVEDAINEARTYLRLLRPAVFACDCCPAGEHKRPRQESSCSVPSPDGVEPADA